LHLDAERAVYAGETLPRPLIQLCVQRRQHACCDVGWRSSAGG
jgi:hypothetical protein